MILRHATIPVAAMFLHPETWTVISPDSGSKNEFTGFCDAAEKHEAATLCGFRRLPMMGAAAVRCGPYGESMIGALRRWGLIGKGDTTIADDGLGVVAQNQWRAEWAAEDTRKREERHRKQRHEAASRERAEQARRQQEEAQRRRGAPGGRRAGGPRFEDFEDFFRHYGYAENPLGGGFNFGQRPGPESAPPPPPPPRAAPPSSHHATLFLLSDAPIEVVQAAHRALALLHHPDRGGDVEKLKAINAARDAIVAAHEGRSPRRARGG